MPTPSPIRVLVVDDSPFYQKLVSEVLHTESGIEVIGYAGDPLEAREKIKLLNPDVLTLDIEMPKMDGLSFLEKIMSLRPMPVIMVSTLTEKGTDATIRALELGAVECVPKPAIGSSSAIPRFAAELVAKVRQAAVAKPRARTAKPKQPPKEFRHHGRIELIAIGASTGGVEATREILMALPNNLPPVVIVQHMPEFFTASYAKRLDGICAMTVCEVAHGQKLESGHAYIAPGNKHLKINGSPHVSTYYATVEDGEKVSSHRPSVDVLFHSVAERVGKKAVGIILTGMGRDGADGLLALRRTGAMTYGENESSCVVYGMPKAAMENGAVVHEKSLHDIPATLCDFLAGGKS